MTTDIDLLRGAKTVLLTTYKRDGTAVSTPVSIAFDGERAFFRTWNTSGKARRLANNPRVEAAPCAFRGRITGPAIQARATLLQGDDARKAASALAKRHPLLQRILVPMAHRLMRYRTMHYLLVADDEPRVGGSRER
jgi:PPOX class probable F420-dependent enzyme